MADLAVGIKDILVTKSVITGLGPGSGWRAYIGPMPRTITAGISIMHAGSWQQSSPKWLLDFPQMQVRVRGLSDGYIDAEARARMVKDALLGLPSQDLNGDRWVAILLGSDVVSIGRDENNLPEFTVNFNLIIEPATNVTTNRVPLNT